MENIVRDAEGRTIEGTCDCGTVVQLGAFTCECDACGRLYNWDGQALRPESEWEESWEDD